MTTQRKICIRHNVSDGVRSGLNTAGKTGKLSTKAMVAMGIAAVVVASAVIATAVVLTQDDNGTYADA